MGCFASLVFFLKVLHISLFPPEEYTLVVSMKRCIGIKYPNTTHPLAFEVNESLWRKVCYP